MISSLATQPQLPVGRHGTQSDHRCGGPDLILGGGGDNILIGGTTNYDRDVAALDAIMAEFTRTDEGFNQRVNNIMNGHGLLKGTGLRLNRTTVHADNSPTSSGAAWAGTGSWSTATTQ